MTREQAKKWIHEITAFANGAAILTHDKLVGWWEVDEPLWKMEELYVINDKHVEAREAYAMGEEIEYKGSDCKWVTTIAPIWLDSAEYRVKSKWIYKQGEIIEVKLEDDIWIQREFIAKTKDNKYFIVHNKVGTGVAIYSEARGLPDE